MLSALAEQGVLPTGDDAKLLQHLRELAAASKDGPLQVPPQLVTAFTVEHYAQRVRYEVSGTLTRTLTLILALALALALTLTPTLTLTLTLTLGGWLRREEP